MCDIFVIQADSVQNMVKICYKIMLIVELLFCRFHEKLDIFLVRIEVAL